MMRSSTLAAAFGVSACLFAAPAHAQSVTLAPVPQLDQVVAHGGQAPPAEQKAKEKETTDPQNPDDQQKQKPAKPEDKKDQPPAVVGETGTKPVRGFGSALIHNLGDDLKHMPRKNSLYWLGAGSALALAIHPEDRKINSRLASTSSLDAVWKPGSVIGEGYVIGPAAVATYAIGRYSHNNRLTHLGMDEIEGTILALGISEGLKEAVRRERPSPNKGQLITGTGYSFPSGHATLTFEAATILQQHLGYRAGIPTYLIASYVAMSRLHDNVHFASDVAFGAGLGILIGRSVTWHGRNFWGYDMNVVPMSLPGGGGIIVSLNAAPSSVSNR
jgi:membrane-associated phospholipid phosphatase